ncbi:MAG TPA: hypothetical protein VK633_12345 [Verrucomicrobiae bacterium]|nr:hypothetical protein [Verrucomicrobiae bacterium]
MTTLIFFLSGLLLRAEPVELRVGARFDVGGRTAEIREFTSLPFIQNEYAKRFVFDSADNPKLKELRKIYQLDKVIASGSSEFEQQVLLNDWVHRQFKKFGHPSDGARGALQVLNGIKEGQAYFCAQYAELLVSTAASLGWNDRLLALRRHQGVNARGGSTEHSTTEIWSSQYRKWVMLDPTSNMYLEKAGVPLNAWEIREEWFYHGGTNLTFVIGRDQMKYRQSDLPILLDHFADFGDLTVDPDELDKYGFIGYIPNTNLMDAGNDYGQMFIVKDKLCEGTQWHQRILPKHPETDPYFPINQAAMELSVENGQLHAAFQTFTPNFKTFEAKFGGGEWQPVGAVITWKLKAGSNRLAVRASNQFGIKGASSILEIHQE